MEHRHAFHGLGILNAQDDLALLVLARVAGGSQHHAHGPLVVPLELDIVGAAFGNRHHDVHQIGLQARQHDLRLGIAETGVVLEHLRALGRQHEAAVEHTAVIVLEGLARRCGGGNPHHMRHVRKLLIGDDGHRGVHAHAARVRAAVAIEGALVVLGGCHAVSLTAGNEREQRALRAGQALLHDHLRTRRAERTVEAAAHGVLGHLDGVGNHDALASGQAVGLHDDGGAQLMHVRKRRLKLGEAAIASRGDAVGLHELLAVRLAALKLRTLRIGAEDRHAGFAQHVGHACYQRRFRADDHQVDGVTLHELQNGLAVLGVQARHVLRDGFRPAVARGRVQVVGTGGFRQGPRNGVLTAAAAQNQDVHVTNPPFPALG